MRLAWLRSLRRSLYFAAQGYRRASSRIAGPSSLLSFCQETTWLVHRRVVAVTSNCMYRPWDASVR
jgi:hypothetical protein